MYNSLVGMGGGIGLASTGNERMRREVPGRLTPRGSTDGDATR